MYLHIQLMCICAFCYTIPISVLTPVIAHIRYYLALCVYVDLDYARVPLAGTTHSVSGGG